MPVKRNRFTVSGFMLIVATAALTMTFCCPDLVALDRRRSVVQPPDTSDYLQYSCWMRDAHAERIARISALVASGRTVPPALIRADENVRRTEPIFTYMRRDLWCSADTLESLFTVEQAREMYESTALLIDTSYFLDEVGW